MTTIAVFRVMRIVLVMLLVAASFNGRDVVAQTTKRPAWTTSRVKGSPEPPLPYRAQRVFPHLGFKQPTVLTSAPGTERLFVAEQAGQIFSIPNVRECRQADLFLDARQLAEQLNESLPDDDKVSFGAVYGLTFHPDFATNRRFYVCYVVSYRRGGRGQHPHLRRRL